MKKLNLVKIFILWFVLTLMALSIFDEPKNQKNKIPPKPLTQKDKDKKLKEDNDMTLWLSVMVLNAATICAN